MKKQLIKNFLSALCAALLITGTLITMPSAVYAESVTKDKRTERKATHHVLLTAAQRQEARLCVPALFRCREESRSRPRLRYRCRFLSAPAPA